ncbi:MAG: helix-turn-helix domain-containing protein [Ignavibacteria bacterium]|nr:helix-turn-helix domain-containing protein [Ignavibacteria bacterium]
MLNNSKSNFLTVSEVSDQLRLSELTIYKYLKSGMLEAVELGGHYRISSMSLAEFIEKHKVQIKRWIK